MAVRIEWFGDDVQNQIDAHLRKNVLATVRHIKKKVLFNIKKPVINGVRSKPGEYPRRDKSKLITTIILKVETVRKGITDGFVGSPQKYSIPLEKKLERQFLSRTFFEELSTIRKLMTIPLKGIQTDITVSGGV